MGTKEKVIVYIDGFNLYFGIKSKFPLVVTLASGYEISKPTDW
jgi:hypothetical protein